MASCFKCSGIYIRNAVYCASSRIHDSWGLRYKTTSNQYVLQRTRDPTFEKLMNKHKNLLKVVLVQTIVLGSQEKALPFQYLSRLQNKLRLKRGAGPFLKKYPHIFEVYKHPTKGNLWFRLTLKAMDLVNAEDQAIKDGQPLVIERLKKLLLISTDGVLPLKALLKVSRPLGLPDDFEDSIITENPHCFRWIRGTTRDNDMVGLVSRDPDLAVTTVEKWRNLHYTREELEKDKDVRFAFKHQYPPGFRINRGYRDKVKKWQRLSYWSPYQDISLVKIRSKGGIKPLEKRAVAILHEFLSLTVEKMVQVEQISHFRKSFNMKMNIRDIFLDHPGIFYLCTKGNVHTIFLREAYRRGRLIERNPVHFFRQKMLELVELGRHVMNLQPSFDESKVNLEWSKGNSEQASVTEEKGVVVSDSLCQSESWDSDHGSSSDSSQDGETEEWDVGSDASDWSET
ncbi:hypothetical protein SUGI_0218710 [Cryptomeria japonica]|uniref:protein ROOT PRIMORDIUM DEFECTIVE 1 n=1 Tax=Cryptomeria japonica TaxID=3369 RepID=UPI002408A381|nr:protein ROOT PRIMORDIUM DEFECTIVE 1 [Cryptomeria japonica]GLJ13709.1 hypothetical protein SUGI_0218710 [Cryptomeria japonica]